MFGPIVLIGLGILLLLSNLDVIDLNFWELLFRFWPVFLIGAGLDILLGRRANGGVLIILMLVLGLVFGAIWLGYVDTSAPFGAVRGETVRQPLVGVSRAEVKVASSVSQLQIQGSASGDALVNGTIALHPNEELEKAYTVDGGIARYALQSGSRSLILPSFSGADDGLWDLQMNRAIPIDLSVSTGVGSATLDLQELNLTALKVNSGVGKVTIVLPTTGNFAAEVESGVGGIEIQVPDTVAIRIKAETGIGSVRVDENYPKQDDVYQSLNYETALNRIDLTISGGIGALAVEQIVLR